jgi:hypothetical protein
MVGTSHARHLHVVESTPNPNQPEVQEPSPPTQEPSPTPAQGAPAEEPTSGASSGGETPHPDTISEDEQADMDARSTGMAMMLRMALRLMKSYGDASPVGRDRGGRRRR